MNCVGREVGGGSGWGVGRLLIKSKVGFKIQCKWGVFLYCAVRFLAVG